MTRWIVDGMNVIGSRPTGWWRDRQGAARRLVERLEQLVEATGDEVTVVLDGRPGPGGPSTEGVVRVLLRAEARAERGRRAHRGAGRRGHGAGLAAGGHLRRRAAPRGGHTRRRGRRRDGAAAPPRRGRGPAALSSDRGDAPPSPSERLRSAPGHARHRRALGYRRIGLQPLDLCGCIPARGRGRPQECRRSCRAAPAAPARGWRPGSLEHRATATRGASRAGSTRASPTSTPIPNDAESIAHPLQSRAAAGIRQWSLLYGRRGCAGPER